MGVQGIRVKYIVRFSTPTVVLCRVQQIPNLIRASNLHAVFNTISQHTHLNLHKSAIEFTAIEDLVMDNRDIVNAALLSRQLSLSDWLRAGSGSSRIRLTAGGRLNKKDGLTRYGNSHVKDKTS